MWKKLLQLCLVSAALVACHAGSGDNNNVPNNPAPKEKVFQIGTNAQYAPFETVSEKNRKLVGFDIDLINAMADAGNFKIKISSFAWDGIFDTLKPGYNDAIISAVTITPERLNHVDFTQPYFEVSQMILTNQENIKTYDDLSGKKVGVIKEQTGNLNREAVSKHVSVIFEYDSFRQLVVALKQQEIDALISENATIQNYVANNADSSFYLIEDKRLSSEIEQYGIAVRKGDEATLKMLNDALDKVRQNGKYDEIYNQYFAPKSTQTPAEQTPS